MIFLVLIPPNQYGKHADPRRGAQRRVLATMKARTDDAGPYRHMK